MATWRNLRVFLSWHAGLTTPRRAWADRFTAEIEASDRLRESERQLAIRVQPLAVELGAIVDIRRSSDEQGLMVRLVAPAIEYVRGANPRKIVESDIEFVGGPWHGELKYLERLPDEISTAGSCYHRALHCAVDDTVRYLWSDDPC